MQTLSQYDTKYLNEAAVASKGLLQAFEKLCVSQNPLVMEMAMDMVEKLNPIEQKTARMLSYCEGSSIEIAPPREDYDLTIVLPARSASYESAPEECRVTFVEADIVRLIRASLSARELGVNFMMLDNVKADFCDEDDTNMLNHDTLEFKVASACQMVFPDKNGGDQVYATIYVTATYNGHEIESDEILLPVKYLETPGDGMDFLANAYTNLNETIQTVAN